MKRTSRLRRVAPGLFGLSCLLFLLPGSAQAAPLDYFLHSAGPATHSTMILGWVFTAICLGVCVLVGILLLASLRGGGKTEDAGRLYSGGSGLRWVFIGTGVSTAVLLAMTVYAFVTLNGSAHPPSTPGLTVTVTGYQWWWEAVYDADTPARRFATANEIHIPTGVPVLVKLKSADVIHAFWVPQLAGKTQMIPGLINQQWLEADEPGIFEGQCTQYCGVQHAHMAFEVVAQKPGDFEAWLEEQRKPAKTVEATAAGVKIFQAQCSGCHAVRGTGASGGHAPDLTHLFSRRMLAAGLTENTPAHLSDWIAHAQELKPGARMPDFVFGPADRDALLAYLQTLH